MLPAEADTVQVAETFVSLQGESSYAGLPCFFIRLAGCNLRCVYCDTPGAFEGGTSRSIDELVVEALSAQTPLIEITGGEPLLQSGCLALLARVIAGRKGAIANRLGTASPSIEVSSLDNGGRGCAEPKDNACQPVNVFPRVLLETNGSISIVGVPREVVVIMDIKCPGSGMVDCFHEENMRLLRSHDEVKFVLSDEVDYRWARDFVCRNRLDGRCAAILFSPVAGRLEPGRLADWIVRDRMPVRLQLQLHKQLGIR